MSQIRYFLRLILTFIIRFRWILIISIFLGFLSFFLIRNVIPYFYPKDSVRIGMTGRFRTDDLPIEILSQISQGLTKISPNGIPEPGLASSWETPDKGKTWIFRLKDGLIWHDKTTIESSDISYKFTDVEIERPDSKTIIFKLKDPFAPFPSVVSKPSFRQGLVGTGNWKVDKLILAGDYIQELSIVNSAKEKKIYKFYPTLERTILAFKLGEIDIIENILDLSPFDSWNTVKVNSETNENQIVVAFFNTQDKALSDKNLRQSLTYAINKDKFGKRALGPFYPASWAYNPQVKQYAYSPDRAKELLDEVPKELKENLEIQLVSSPNLLATAESIKLDWENIGIKSNLQISPIIPNEFQVFLTILDVAKDPDQYPLWHSTQTETNISKYSDLRIDKLLEEGRIQLDTEERRKIYLDFQRFLLEDAPAAFLYHPTYYTVIRK